MGSLSQLGLKLRTPCILVPLAMMLSDKLLVWGKNNCLFTGEGETSHEIVSVAKFPFSQGGECHTYEGGKTRQNRPLDLSKHPWTLAQHWGL